RDLVPHYDAVLPMAYWTYRTKGEAETRSFIARSIQLIRQRGGDPDVPIHVIGGIANLSKDADLRGFARAIRSAGVVGASFYDAETSGPEDWAVLREIRSTFRGTAPPPPTPEPVLVAVPPPPGRWALDPTATRLAEGDRVAFTFRAGGAAAKIVLRGYDITPGEVRVRLNGRRVGSLRGTDADAWGPRQELLILGTLEDRNRITFDNVLNPPGAQPWGVEIRGLAAFGPV
ncbi:MAG TPA: hypothetical protein VGB28_04830, partial [Actinomycetota bacterium]